MALAKSLVAICGTTGVGKSRLAIDLALAFPCGARIINADAMQAYEGTDILTNKVPLSEQRGIEHLLMSFKKPGEQYVVGEWVKDAMREIDKTHAEGKIPIVVGGTSYWIHHLLFLGSLPSRGVQSQSTISEQSSSHLQYALRSLPEALLSLYNKLPSLPPSARADPDQASALHQLLVRLDPVMGNRWHWKDTRKVLRNLEIIKEYGRSASEIVTEESKLSTVARYNALIFWLYSSPGVLDLRLDKRVDEMLEQGLVDELRSMHGTGSTSANINSTLGVYQAIGYKEFSDVLVSQTGQDESEKSAYSCAIEAMKHSTKKYAKRQVKWIRNKLLPTIEACKATSQSSQESKLCVKAYLLDATEVETSWTENIMSPAKDIASAFLSGQPTPDPLSLSAIAREMLQAPDRPIKYTTTLGSVASQLISWSCRPVDVLNSCLRMDVNGKHIYGRGLTAAWGEAKDRMTATFDSTHNLD